MVRRTTRALIALALAAPAVVLCGPRAAAAQGRAPAALSYASMPVGRAQTAAAVAWVIRAADVVACETPAPELRRLQREHGDQVRLTVYYVGGDTALARSFLRKERLGGVHVEQRSERQIRRELGHVTANPASPMLVVSAEGAPPRYLFADVRTPEGRRDVDRLGIELGALLSRNAVSHGVALNHPLNH